MGRLTAALVVVVLALGMAERPAAAIDPPAVTVSSTQLAPGEVVTVRGVRWKAGREVAIVLPPGGRRTVTASGDGTFETSYQVPANATTGQNRLSAYGPGADNTSGYAYVDVSITAPKPTLTVDDAEADAGQTLTVSGTRWKAGRQVNLVMAPGRARTTATVAGDGTFSAGLEVPASTTTGPYRISAYGPGADGVSGYAAVDIRVTAPVPIVVAPRRIAAGGDTTVRGEHWKAGRQVRVTLSAVDVEVRVTAGEDGAFEAALDLPDTPFRGDARIEAFGAGSDGVTGYAAVTVTIGGETSGEVRSDVFFPRITRPDRARPDLDRGALPTIETRGGSSKDSSRALVVALLILLILGFVLLLYLAARRRRRRPASNRG